MTEKKHIVIIGSGLGGLACGVMLAKNGYRITVLEQGAQPGGCLQCFYRGNAKFETGMHYIGSMAKGQAVYKVLRYLEAIDDLRLRPLDADGYDVVSLGGRQYRFPLGRKNFIARMSEYFPSQKENLARYYDLITQIANASALHTLRDADETLPLSAEYNLRAVNEVVEGIITDPLAAKVLVGNLALYAGERDKTPFATHAFITDFYNQSAYRIVGGSDTLAQSLVRTIEQYGGRVLLRSKATEIVCDATHATGVEVNGERIIEADGVVSDIHPVRMVELLHTPLIRPAFRSRLRYLPQTSGCFTVYVKFKPNAQPYQNYNYFAYNGDTPWGSEQYTAEEWPKSFLYMHQAPTGQSEYAEAAEILVYMNIRDVEQWRGTRVGHRGEAYEAFKREREARVLASLEKHFPGVKERIEKVYSSTPLTYLDYTGTADGSMYGCAKDVNLGIGGRAPKRTRVPNLFLTGQNIVSHGMLGTLVGAIVTCSEWVGEAELYRQIEEANN